MDYQPPRDQERSKGRVMRLRRSSQAALCGMLAVAVTAIAPSAWATHAAPSRPVIRSVTFSGSARHPTITISRIALRGETPA